MLIKMSSQMKRRSRLFYVKVIVKRAKRRRRIIRKRAAEREVSESYII